MASIDDPVLVRLRAALDEAYGQGLDRVVLFGSRASGDARPDSDDDVAVFLRDFDGFGREAAGIAAIETDILFDTGAVIDALPFRAGAYDDRTAPAWQPTSTCSAPLWMKIGLGPTPEPCGSRISRSPAIPFS